MIHRRSIVDIYGHNMPGINNSFDQAFSYSNKTWCDAKDYQGIWRVGRIRKAGDNIVIVKFDGWSDKFKQSFCKHSDMLAPLRTHTIGYTGQLKIALRDFEFNIENIQKMEKKLKLLMSDDKLTSFDPLEITSFIRGDLFILVDSILTLNETLDAKYSSQINSFINNMILLGIKWMGIAISNLKAMSRYIGLDKSTHLEDLRTHYIHIHHKPSSLYLAGYEILLSMRSIFGFDNRCNVFYKMNNPLFNPRQYMMNFIQNGGLQKLNDLISFEDIEANGNLKKIGFDMLLPLIYTIPKICFEVKEMYYMNDLDTFINNMYYRLQYEFDHDSQFNMRFIEKNLHFKEFIRNLKNVHTKLHPNKFYHIDLLLSGIDYAQDDQDIADNIFDHMESPRNSIIDTDIRDISNINIGEPNITNTNQIDQNDQLILDNNGLKSQFQFELSAINQKQYALKDDVTTNQVKPKSNDNDYDTLKEKCAYLEGELKTLTSKLSTMKDDIIKEAKKLYDDNSTKNNPNTMVDKYFTEAGINGVELKDSLKLLKNINQVFKTNCGNENRDVGLAKPKDKVMVLTGDNTDQHDRLHNNRDNVIQSNSKLDNIYTDNLNDFEFGTSEDELKTLTAIELLISENRLLEATKLIKWRKKIIKLAHMNGWDVAKIIAQNTIKKLDITTADIIISNLCFLQKNDDLIGLSPTLNDKDTTIDNTGHSPNNDVMDVQR